MNLKCIGLVISFYVFFVCQSIAQKNNPYSPEFYNYLKQQNLVNEQLTYLNTLEPVCDNVVCSDTLSLLKALCFYALNDLPSSARLTDSIKTFSSFSERSSQEKYISLLFIQRKIQVLKKILPGADTNSGFARQSKLFLQVLNREKVSIKTGDSLFENNYTVKGIVNRYQHGINKSPFGAGLLSTLVPGLGKLYVGYKYQAISAFIINVFFGGQAAEAIIRSGYKSVHFIYSCSVFGAYYIGNIIGSVMAAKKKKRDALNQLDNEIIFYYNNRLDAYSN